MPNLRGTGWRWLGWTATGVLLGALLISLTGGIVHWRTRRLVDDGAALVSEGRYVPAARSLLEAVSTTPGDARAHYYLGLAYAGLGQETAALRHTEDAVRLSPSEPEYETGLAMILLDAGRDREALAHLHHAADLRPGACDIRLLLADALRRAGDRDEMVHEYRVAVRLGGGSALGALAREQLKAAMAERPSIP